MQLTERAKQLIPKARIVSFRDWQHPEETIKIFQQADDESRYLTDEDLEKISSNSVEYVKFLRDHVSEIVDLARQEVLVKYPNITEKGGDLYPAERAKACWRDFWHFLRCTTYGIAGENPQYTSQEGLDNMKLLYEELQVPLLPMVTGLEGLKKFALQNCSSTDQIKYSPYFDHLINKMKSFVEV